MEKIVFNKSDCEFELISYKTDENGHCYEPCPYGQGWTDKEHEENILFAIKLGVPPPDSQTYLIGTAPCVRRCKYSKGKTENIKAVMCSYKFQQKNKDNPKRMNVPEKEE